MNDGTSPSDDLEHTVNANASGQTFADENARQQRREIIEEEMADLDLLGSGSSKAAVERAVEGVAEYHATVRERTSFASNPLAKAVYELKLALGMTTPEKELEKQRGRLEERVRRYDRVVENIKDKREGIQQEYFELHDRRDKSIRLRAAIKDELADVRDRMAGMNDSYVGQPGANGSGYEGEKSASEMRRDYHDAERHSERLFDYMKMVNQEIERVDDSIKAKRAAIVKLTGIKDRVSYTKAAKVGGVLIPTGDHAAVAGFIVSIARADHETDADTDEYIKNARAMQDAAEKLEDVAHRVMDNVKPNRVYNGSYASPVGRRDAKSDTIRKAYEQLDDRVEQIVQGLRTEPLGWN
ncbi:hypothetical protein HYV82_02885 [Candidatus Woesearchaeota archaeon]|nr:hypothetical protein [Candidatus Woesearchaeota archaeon]